MDLQFHVGTIVLQPTTLCNLDCEYCYLPERARDRRMSSAVAEQVARYVDGACGPIEILWHGGEPTACDLERFETLIAPFRRVGGERVVHHLVTNGTRIDDLWCDFFGRHGIRVGVSLDGPEWANRGRLTRGGKPSDGSVLRGIEHLVRRGISFAILAVVGHESLSRAAELYRFFRGLGCSELGLLVEERQPLRVREVPDDDAVFGFWRDLLEVWRADPGLRVRELATVLAWIENPRVFQPSVRELRIDLMPSVAANGDVSLLSPELVNLAPYVVGNVLAEPLASIVARWDEHAYVADHVAGIGACRRECGYFAYCTGGLASHKIFELGSARGTETAFCRNSQKRLADAVLAGLAPGRSRRSVRDLRRSARDLGSRAAAWLAASANTL